MNEDPGLAFLRDTQPIMDAMEAHRRRLDAAVKIGCLVVFVSCCALLWVLATS